MTTALAHACDLIELPLRDARREFDRRYFAYQLGFAGGNRSAIAHRAGLGRAAVHRLLKRLSLV